MVRFRQHNYLVFFWTISFPATDCSPCCHLEGVTEEPISEIIEYRDIYRHLGYFPQNTEYWTAVMASLCYHFVKKMQVAQLVEWAPHIWRLCPFLWPFAACHSLSLSNVLSNPSAVPSKKAQQLPKNTSWKENACGAAVAMEEIGMAVWGWEVITD